MTLFILATPIGNLDDLSERAARTLREVELVCAEDTRHARTLLTRAGATTPLRSYHEHSTDQDRARILALLREGKDIALISDAGTPCIADPGYRLVREAHEAGVRVCPIPGPSALIAFLSAAGLPTDRFTFDGFLPAKEVARQRRLEELLELPRTVVLYESPRRLEATLNALDALAPEREIVVARELTKVHERFYRGPAAALREQLEREGGWRGEVVLGIAGAPEREPSEQELEGWVETLAAEGLSARSIATVLQKQLGASKRQGYELALRWQQEQGPDGGEAQ